MEYCYTILYFDFWFYHCDFDQTGYGVFTDREQDAGENAEGYCEKRFQR